MPPRHLAAFPPIPHVAPSPPYGFSRLRPRSLRLHEPGRDTTQVPEALVQDLWRRQQFDVSGLETTEGRRVRVIRPGSLNTDAGPDFFHAHLALDGLEWHGDVEVHTRSGIWFEHGHHDDPRYNRVTLHVTLHRDAWTGSLTREDGSTLPEVVLHPRLHDSLRSLLVAFYTRDDADALPCADRWPDVPEPIRRTWIERGGVERMHAKADRLEARLDVARDGTAALDAVLHRRLFAGLGYAKNDVPMTLLAERLPLDAVRSLDDALDREALHFGAAALLPEPGDLLDADRATADAVMDRRHRFARLQATRSVPTMERPAWTFFRLRPNNFPTLRIAQAVAWFAADGLLASDPLPRLRDAVTSSAPVARLRAALQSTPTDFWRTHYRLTTSTSERDPSLGTSRIDTLLVNAVAPVLLLDADRRGDADQSDAVFSLLRTLPAGRDHVVRRFRDLGTRPQNALDTQGMHRVYRTFCSTGGCLRCEVGQAILTTMERKQESE